MTNHHFLCWLSWKLHFYSRSRPPHFLIGLVPKTKGTDGGNACRQIFKKNTIVFGGSEWKEDYVEWVKKRNRESQCTKNESKERVKKLSFPCFLWEWSLHVWFSFSGLHLRASFVSNTCVYARSGKWSSLSNLTIFSWTKRDW